MSGDNGCGKEGKAVARRPDRTPLIRRDPVQLAQHFAASGFFADARDMSKAIVKIVAGEELGIGPMASMTGIHIIDGKPSLSANLMAVQVKRSGRYDYRVLEEDDSHIKLAWFDDDEEIGTSEFTDEQAETAGLLGKKNWQQYREDMRFSRALARGVRRHCPEVTAGTPAYTPEELGADVNAEGEPVYVEAEVEVHDPEPAASLDPQLLTQLVEGLEIVKPTLEDEGNGWLDGLNLRLGALGINAFEPVKGIDDQLAALGTEDAEKLDAEIQSIAEAQDDAPSEEQEAEGVAADG